jgi:hypothetical protein
MTFVICYAKRIAINHNPFYSYRKNRKNSIMSNLNSKRIFDRQFIIDTLIISKKNIPNLLKFIINERCIGLWYNIFNDVFTLEEKYKNDKMQIIKYLNKQKNILLYDFKLKNYIYFFLLTFFGAQITYSLKIKIKEILKTKTIIF